MMALVLRCRGGRGAGLPVKSVGRFVLTDGAAAAMEPLRCGRPCIRYWRLCGCVGGVGVWSARVPGWLPLWSMVSRSSGGELVLFFLESMERIPCVAVLAVCMCADAQL
eukprot:TRINITY_DN1480_c0_g1_i9.p3 TRINITY_DN1480_c0_g1~~TRINITY_DN1480_c0_g1_i9.p3  ORF type:complete len:109 (+),score=0.58 TRINITY_DN1480_c0_g1_i9:1038-1364(+)